MREFVPKPSWVALHPEKRSDIPYWRKVLMVLENVGVKASDASTRQIRNAMFCVDLDERTGALKLGAST